MEVYQTLHDKPPPKEMVARRERVFARLEELKAAAARLVAIVEDPAALQRLIDNGHYDWEGIQEEYGLPDSALDAYAELAKFNYDCGEYKVSVLSYNYTASMSISIIFAAYC
jgi:eIF3 subunit 6 N terminal domain